MSDNSLGQRSPATKAQTSPSTTATTPSRPHPPRLGSLRSKQSSIERSETLGEVRRVNQYKIMFQLGEGAYGKVMMAQHVDTNENFAIKIMSRAVLMKRRKKMMTPRRKGGNSAEASNPADDLNDPFNMMLREIAIMKKLQHEHVVRLVEVIEYENTDEIFMVMEYMSCGTVCPDEEECDPISESQAWSHFRCLVDALDYCHTNGVIHCDIKPANLLLNSDGIVKVSDFGTSRLMAEDGSSYNRGEYFDDTVSKVMGSAAFLSPQACQGGEFSGKALDIWASGVTLYFMVFGRTPFRGEGGLSDLYESIQNDELEFPDEVPISPELKDLLRKMMAKEESDRIKLKEIMVHDWVTQNGTKPLSKNYEVLQITQRDMAEAMTIMTQMQSMVNFYININRKVHEVTDLIRSRTTVGQKTCPYTLNSVEYLVLQPGFEDPESLRAALTQEDFFKISNLVKARFRLHKLAEMKLDSTVPSTTPSELIRAYIAEPSATTPRGHLRTQSEVITSNGKLSTAESMNSITSQSLSTTSNSSFSSVSSLSTSSSNSIDMSSVEQPQQPQQQQQQEQTFSTPPAPTTRWLGSFTHVLAAQGRLRRHTTNDETNNSKNSIQSNESNNDSNNERNSLNEANNLNETNNLNGENGENSENKVNKNPQFRIPLKSVVSSPTISSRHKPSHSVGQGVNTKEKLEDMGRKFSESTLSIVSNRGMNLADMGMSVEAETAVAHGLNLEMIAKCTNSEKAVYSFNSMADQSVNGLEDEQEHKSNEYTPESIIDYYQAYKEKKSSPLAVIERLIAHITVCAHMEPPMTAVTAYNSSEAFDQAIQSEQRWNNNSPLSVLDGVPFVVSEDIAVAGLPTKYGTQEAEENYERDAFVIAKLRAAGAIVFGKTAIQQLNFPLWSQSSREKSLNPFDPSLSAGGGSFGAAMAVGMGLCPFAIASDSCGSARISAGLCGLASIKATFGRLSTNGCSQIFPETSHTTIISQTTTDAAMVYAVISGLDSDDTATHDQPRLTLTNFGPGANIRNHRIGVWREWFDDCSPSIGNICSEIVKRLQNEKGSTSFSFAIENLPEMMLAHFASMSADLAAYLDSSPYLLDDCNDGIVFHVSIANNLSEEDIELVHKARTSAIENLKVIFKHCDCFVMPTFPLLASELKTESKCGDSLEPQLLLSKFTFLSNFIGFPTVCVRAGYDEKTGEPISCLVMCRPWHESTALRVARVIETFSKAKRPQIHFSQLPPKY